MHMRFNFIALVTLKKVFKQFFVRDFTAAEVSQDATDPYRNSLVNVRTRLSSPNPKVVFMRYYLWL